MEDLQRYLYPEIVRICMEYLSLTVVLLDDKYEPKAIYTLVDDRKHGLCVELLNNKLKVKENYYHGMLHGERIVYDSKGEIRAYYDNNILIKHESPCIFYEMEYGKSVIYKCKKDNYSCKYVIKGNKGKYTLYKSGNIRYIYEFYVDWSKKSSEYLNFLDKSDLPYFAMRTNLWTEIGIYCLRFNNGQVILNIQYDKNVKHISGFYKEYEEESTFINGVLHGRQTIKKRSGNSTEIIHWNMGVKDGLYTYSNNSLTYHNSYKNGKLHGKVVSYKSWSTVISEYVNGELHGEYVVGNKYGVERICYYRNGKLHGRDVKYHDNKTIAYDTIYIDGVCQDDHKEYHPNGAIWNVYGYKHGEFKIVKSWYSNGNIQYDYNDGYPITYDFDGGIITELKYDEDNKTDVHIEYGNLGNIKCRYQQKNGLKHGLCEEFHDNNVLASAFNYVENYKHGKGVAFHENGDKDYEASYYNKRFHGVYIKYINNKISIKIIYEHGERRVYEKFNADGERICYFELRDKYIVGPWYKNNCRFDGKVYTVGEKKYEFGLNAAFIVNL